MNYINNAVWKSIGTGDDQRVKERTGTACQFRRKDSQMKREKKQQIWPQILSQGRVMALL
jgi:hypothetical protein